MKRDIILSGVGGQGILSIAAVIGRAALEDGLHIKQAEVHGMSQRGGSVSTQVHWGEKVHSPVIGKGAADIIVAFEKMEAVRYADYLKPDGVAVINDYEIEKVFAEQLSKTFDSLIPIFCIVIVFSRKLLVE